MPAAPTIGPLRRLAGALAASCAGAAFASGGAPHPGAAPLGLAAAAELASRTRPGDAAAAGALPDPLPPRLAALAARRPESAFVAPVPDAQPTLRRPPLPPDAPDAPRVEGPEGAIGGPAQAMLVLAGLIGWIALRRSR